MELGGFMDDGLFSETRDRNQRTAPVAFNAKVCNSEWFEDTSREDVAEKMQLHKYGGDWAYRSRDYDKALQHYQSALGKGMKETLLAMYLFKDLIPQTNLTMRRDVLESLTRCHLQLNQPEDALNTATQLAAINPSFDQQTVYLSLVATVYRALGRHQDELLALQKCLWMHPMNCDQWARLAELYTALLTPSNPARIAQTPGQNSTTDTETRAPGQDSELTTGLESLTVGEDGKVSSRVSLDCAQGLGVSDKGDGVESSYSATEGFTVLTGMEPRHVICTCLLRARALASCIRKHPEFVIKRYKKICEAMTEQLQSMNLGEDMINKCSEVVTVGIHGDDGSPTEDSSDGALLEQIQDVKFPAIFERQWFSWS